MAIGQAALVHLSSWLLYRAQPSESWMAHNWAYCKGRCILQLRNTFYKAQGSSVIFRD